MDPDFAVFDERPRGNKIREMIAHMLLHRARRAQVLADLRVDLWPVFPNPRLEEASERTQILVERLPTPMQFVRAAHALLKGQVVIVEPTPLAALSAAHARTLDDDLE